MTGEQIPRKTSGPAEQSKPPPPARELKFPPHIQELRTQYLRIKAPLSAQRMWDRMLIEKDRERLGGDLQQAYWAHGTAGMWMKLHGVALERAVIDVAFGIGCLDQSTRDWLLREVGQRDGDSQRTVDEALLQSKLVLIDQPRQAFWNGEPIEIDWDKEAALWSLFLELCQKSKRSQAVKADDLSEKMTPSAFSTRKGRLVNHAGFPPTLAILIDSKPGGGYQLTLPQQDIRIFLVEQEDTVKEWTGSAPPVRPQELASAILPSTAPAEDALSGSVSMASATPGTTTSGP